MDLGHQHYLVRADAHVRSNGQRTGEDDDNGIKLGMLGGLHFHFYQIRCADV